MKICTHDGRFHCDEVLACTMLKNYVQKYKEAQIIRSRNIKDWQQSDIIVDVGGKYQPPKQLDHHQIQFTHTYPNYPIKLSSAGLVYLHFPQIIPNIINHIQKLQCKSFTFKPIRNQQIQDQIRQKIYKSFIIFIDANDNGVQKINQKQYVHVPTTLWSRIAKLNSMWWEENPNQMERFQKAMDVAKEQLYSEVKQNYLGSIQTKFIVWEAFRKRKQDHASGKIIVLQKYVPWQKSVVQIEHEQNCDGLILFIIFPEKNGRKWRIQAVSSKQGSFEIRKSLKEEWRGIKDIQKLATISGIKDIQFVHVNGFIGGAVSKESAIRMGELSL